MAPKKRKPQQQRSSRVQHPPDSIHKAVLALQRSAQMRQGRSILSPKTERGVRPGGSWDKFYEHNPYGGGYGQQVGDFTIPAHRSDLGPKVIRRYPGHLPPGQIGDGNSGRYGGPAGPVPPSILGDEAQPDRPTYRGDDRKWTRLTWS